MVRLAYKVAALFFAAFLPATALHGGNCHEYSKTIKKISELAEGGTVSLSNKYGSVKVIGWQENKVKIEASILVWAESEASAQRTFNRIKLAFTESRDYVSAETQAIQQKREWWFWGEKEDDYTVSYRAYVPRNCKLIVRNRHGNVDIEGVHGPTQLAVHHGNLTAGQLFADAEVFIEDGIGVIEQAERLKVELQQARFRLEQARLLEVQSHNSQLWIDQADEVLSESKYDTYELEWVGRFVNTGEFDRIEIARVEEAAVTSKLSELFLERVHENLWLQIDSSAVWVGAVEKGFREVDLSGRFTDFLINIEEGASYQMDAVADFAGIRYPRSLKVTYEREAGTKHAVRGHAGGQNPPPLLRARLAYGALKVGQNN